MGQRSCCRCLPATADSLVNIKLTKTSYFDGAISQTICRTGCDTPGEQQLKREVSALNLY